MYICLYTYIHGAIPMAGAMPGPMGLMAPLASPWPWPDYSRDRRP